jgi:lysophospholipid acyltransferase
MLYLGASWIGLVLAQTLTIYTIAKKVSKPFMAITILSFLILGYLHYDRITVIIILN